MWKVHATRHLALEQQCIIAVERAIQYAAIMKKFSRGGDQQYNEPSSSLLNNAFMFINQSLPNL